MMDPKFKRSQSVDKREAVYHNSHQKNHLQNNNGINIHNQNRKEFKPSNKNDYESIPIRENFQKE